RAVKLSARRTKFGRQDHKAGTPTHNPPHKKKVHFGSDGGGSTAKGGGPARGHRKDGGHSTTHAAPARSSGQSRHATPARSSGQAPRASGRGGPKAISSAQKNTL